MLKRPTLRACDLRSNELRPSIAWLVLVLGLLGSGAPGRAVAQAGAPVPSNPGAPASPAPTATPAAPLPASASAPVAATDPDFFRELLAAAIGGKPIVDVVARWEYAKQDQQQHSHSATLRTRLGYQTGELRGFTALAEMSNTVSPKPSGYFDGVEANEGPQTIVGDPESTHFNQGWLQFAKKEWAGLNLRGGRQRINLDDDRWIGNVGWRQNEQTFDAARLQTSLGVDKLLAQYIYTWEVNRIWGDQGPALREDFDPRGHFINVAYAASPAFNAVGFAYLTDPDQDFFRSFGSQTYGVRFSGAIPVNEKLSFPYAASYAYQEDWGNNETSYGAHYGWLEAGSKLAGVGGISVGYEHLGSDTDAVVVTPFATAHKFNGYADAFLNNGGNRGLRDLFVNVVPALPIPKTTLALSFHQFWDDQGGDELGQEYDAVATYALNQYVVFLWKGAYFDGGQKPAFSKVTRSTLQVTFKF